MRARWLGRWRRNSSRVSVPAAGRVPIRLPGRGGCEPTSTVDLQLAFDADQGNFAISVDDAPNGTRNEKVKFTILQITSDSGLFIGNPAQPNSAHDFFSTEAIIKQDLDGFSEFSIDSLVAPGVGIDFLLNDISIDAVLTDNSRIGKIRAVPETATTTVIVLLSLIIGRRQRTCSTSGGSFLGGAGTLTLSSFVR